MKFAVESKQFVDFKQEMEYEEFKPITLSAEFRPQLKNLNNGNSGHPKAGRTEANINTARILINDHETK